MMISSSDFILMPPIKSVLHFARIQHSGVEFNSTRLRISCQKMPESGAVPLPGCPKLSSSREPVVLTVSQMPSSSSAISTFESHIHRFPSAISNSCDSNFPACDRRPSRPATHVAPPSRRHAIETQALRASCFGPLDSGTLPAARHFLISYLRLPPSYFSLSPLASLNVRTRASPTG